MKSPALNALNGGGAKLIVALVLEDYCARCGAVAEMTTDDDVPLSARCAAELKVIS